MSDHLAVLKPRLIIDIIIWSWENVCKEHGKKSRKREQEKEQEQEQEHELEQEQILTEMS